MNRAWIAVAIVGIVIAGVIVYEVAFRGQGTQPSGEPVATVIGQKASTAGPAVIKAPPPKAQPGKSPESEKGKEPPEPAKKEPEAKKPEPAGPSADAVVKAAETQIAAGKKVEAQKLLSDALTKDPLPANPEPAKALLTKLNEELIFSTKPSPLAVTHVVKEKEDLVHIAKQHKTTVELILKINPLIKNPNVIQLNQKVRVIPGAFDVEVIKGKFLLTVYKSGIWVREFKVGLGKAGSTPVGQFIASTRIKDPPYTGAFPHVPASDHKNNPLGTRWIGIEGEGAGKQYGIHGTWGPDSIGKEESKGCIRMRNEDVEWLFELIVPGESKITIKP